MYVSDVFLQGEAKNEESTKLFKFGSYLPAFFSSNRLSLQIK